MKPIKCNKCENDMEQSKIFEKRWKCMKCNMYYETDMKEYKRFHG